MKRTDLIEARARKGLTQTQLAALIDAYQGDVSKIEQGKLAITVERAPLIAKALDLDVLAVLYPQPNRRAA